MRHPSRLIVLAAAAALLAAPAAAFEPEVLYETEIPGFTLASGWRIAVDDDGTAFVVAGYQGDLNDILVTRIGPDGTPGWQTTLHGSDIDIATAVELDGAGHVVVAGWTDSPDFPTTDDGLYPSQVNFRDAFLVKLDASTGHLVYGTYLGAVHTEQASAMTIADDGTIWLAGSTDSPDFPTTPDALQPQLGNSQFLASDAFVTAISADGQEILYSSYFGAITDDAARGIGIAPDGSIVIAGTTDSADFPLAGGLQGSMRGSGTDAFVARLSSDGTQLLASAVLGGAGYDMPWGFALGPDGSVHLAGRTSARDFPTTPDAVQPDFSGPPLNCEVPFAGDRECYEGFVARISPEVDQLLFGTFLGGAEDDELRDIAVGPSGTVHVAGYSFSPDYPVTAGPGGFGIVAAQLAPDGTDLDYAILLDADGSTNSGHGIAVDPSGATSYVTGARHVPYSVYVARLTGASLLFADGFESGDTSAWSR